MNLAAIKVGDVVRCEVRGREFEAGVIEVLPSGHVLLAPPRGVTYHRVTARQVRKRVARAAFDPTTTQRREP